MLNNYLKKILFCTLFSSVLLFSLKNIETKLPFIEGEKLKFKITYLGITGGHAEFEAKKLANNKLKFELIAYTEDWTSSLYTLSLSHISYVEESNFQILKHTEIKSENDRYYNGVQLFYPDEKHYIFTARNRERLIRSDKIDYDFSGGLSIVSAFFYMRTFKNLEIGKKYMLNAFIRENPRPLEVNVVRREKKNTFYGKKDTVVLAPITDFKGFIDDQDSMEIFISDDKYRIPLVMESKLLFGKVKAYLIEPNPFPQE